MAPLNDNKQALRPGFRELVDTLFWFGVNASALLVCNA